MKKSILLLIIFIISSTACTSRPASQDTENSASKDAMRFITDITGRQVKIPVTVKSIICINSGSLRLTTYMQAINLVVGIEDNERSPSVSKPFNYVNTQLFSSLPVIGDNGKTYDEEIVKLAPDIVIATTDKDTADILQRKLNIPVVAISFIDNMFDEKSYATFRLLGEIYGRQKRADELISYIKAIDADFRNRTASIPEINKPTVYAGGVSFKGSRGLDGTEANYFPFVAIGAINLADRTGQPGAFSIDLEQLLKWDPDIIFLDFSGMTLIEKHYADNPNYYNALTAIKEDRIYSQIPFRSNAVNIEIALADAYYAGKVIFPEQFKEINPADKADEIFEMMLGKKYYDVLRQNGYDFGKIRLGE
jgi:iron complex transport system substrate-binding protein